MSQILPWPFDARQGMMSQQINVVAAWRAPGLRSPYLSRVRTQTTLVAPMVNDDAAGEIGSCLSTTSTRYAWYLVCMTDGTLCLICRALALRLIE